jgi:hypothetical protein
MADLSAYPDLVVIFLGMRVEEPRGLETLQTLSPRERTRRPKPDKHEELVGACPRFAWVRPDRSWRTHVQRSREVHGDE